MESISIKVTDHGIRKVSVESLLKNHKNTFGEFHDKYHKFENGWMSTSTKWPELGNIFMDIENPAVVSFIDKYNKMHTGILQSLRFEKSLNRVFASVKSSTVNMFHDSDNLIDGCINCLVSLESLTVIEGQLPKVQTPKFNF